jgi:molybdopterin-guanine dinucleotide biosynthesis protein A
VVAKPSSPLPELEVPVWLEPEEPTHPLAGLVRALEAGPVVAVGCDQPFVTPELLRALAQARAVPEVDGRLEPFPGAYDPSQLPVLRAALAAEAPVRATVAQLDPPRLAVDARLVENVNTPEQLAAAEARLRAR